LTANLLVIRVATVQHAIVGQLRNPSPGFEDIIQTHFYLRQREIMEQCKVWLEEAKPDVTHYETLQKHVAAMEAEFLKLQKPKTIVDYEKEKGIEPTTTESSHTPDDSLSKESGKLIDEDSTDDIECSITELLDI